MDGTLGDMAITQRAWPFKRRKGLRLRSQVYMAITVAAWVVLANVVIALWYFTKPSGRCAYALTTRKSGCSDVDAAGIVALIGGVLLSSHSLSVLYHFVRAPLRKLPGEETSQCFIDNGSKVHNDFSKLSGKAVGSAVVGFELLVALIPLSPYYYVLGLAPTGFAAMMAAQAYLKV